MIHQITDRESDDFINRPLTRVQMYCDTTIEFFRRSLLLDSMLIEESIRLLDSELCFLKQGYAFHSHSSNPIVQ
jgi:hypothetical protein